MSQRINGGGTKMRRAMCRSGCGAATPPRTKGEELRGPLIDGVRSLRSNGLSEILGDTSERDCGDSRTREPIPSGS
ncbi:hypothetical protein TNCV_2746091 [Trichonephila clavipes]|nr:hypothetical protein TNCV_2746091 [Trichonephila clavipes]